MTVAENMAFGLRIQRSPKAEVQARVQRAAEILQLGGLLDRKPRALSGGQRQRVALGRALVRDPQVFLLDEPLSILDAKLRLSMRVEIARLHRQLEATMIYVTHDQVEAMTLASRIVVLNGGRIEQVGAPMELYRKPANKFVAGFLGSPRMNFLSAERLATASRPVAAGDFSSEVPETPLNGLREAVIVGVRPEDLRCAVAAEDPGPGSRAGTLVLRGEVTLLERLGGEALAHVCVGGPDDETVIAKLAGDETIS
jgi:multiple sugar transport system ATP-binding protein